MQKAHNNVDWKNWPDISTPLSQSNLNAMDQSIDVIDDRVIVLDTTKANQSDLLTAVARLDFDDETGILTIYYKNGLTDTIDTGLAKLTMNWDYDNDPASEHYQDLVLEMADGTYKYVDLSALINNHEFADTSTINITITNGVVSADVIDGSITDQKLETNYLANITTQANHAAQAASAAAISESNASDSADDSEDSALVSEGWAVGKQNGVDVEVGSDYFENNSKYYKEQAEASATNAAGSATAAGLSAGSAQNAFVGASEIQTDVTNMRNAVRTWQQDVQQNATSVASNTATAQTASNTAVNASNAAVAANSSAQSAATRAEAAADRAEEIVDISVMTTSRNGIGKPDGVTITVDANGTFSAAAGVTLQFVDTLPPISTAIESVIYCLKTQSTGSDIYEEYVVGYDEQEQREWVQIGDTSVNLSGYATTNYVDTADNQVQGNLTTHVNTLISTENGVHGIRFYNNKLQRWVPDAWIDIETSGMDWDVQGKLGAKNLFAYPYYIMPTSRATNANELTYWSNAMLRLNFDREYNSTQNAQIFAKGCLTVTGYTSSSAVSMNLHSITSSINDMILEEGSYKLSGCPSGGSDITYKLELFTNAGVLATDTGSGASFTVVSNSTNETDANLISQKRVRVGARIVVGANYTVQSPLTFKPLIRLSNDNSTTFTPPSRTNRELSAGYKYARPVKILAGTFSQTDTETILIDRYDQWGSMPQRHNIYMTYYTPTAGIDTATPNTLEFTISIKDSQLNPSYFSIRSYVLCNNYNVLVDSTEGAHDIVGEFPNNPNYTRTVSTTYDSYGAYIVITITKASGNFTSDHLYALEGFMLYRTAIYTSQSIIESDVDELSYYYDRF